MGRPKTYDRTDVARKAMDLFWRQGYGATSIADLEKHISINRYSLFAEFGNKQGLFEAAMKIYQEEVVTSYMSGIEKEDAGLAELRELLAYFRTYAKSPEASRGCLNCNTATELVSLEGPSQEFVEAHINRLSHSITSALQNAKRSGEIRADANVENEGHYFSSAIMGLFVILRSRTTFDVVEGVINALDHQLDRLNLAEKDTKDE